MGVTIKRRRAAAGTGARAEELLILVGDIYQAGLEPERWPVVIARMSQAFAADLACIYTPFPACPEQALYLTHNFTREMEQAYGAYYHRLDEWTGAALRQGRYLQGTVALGEEIVPQSELRRTEYYQDFLKVHDMEWMVTTALLDGRAEGPATHMSFTRHRDRRAYDGDGKRLIALLAPHVRRALLTHWRLAEARLGGEAREAALDHLGHGVLLLDETGRAVYLNPLAETLLRRNDGLTLRDGQPRAQQGDDDQALARLVRQAVLGVGGGLNVARRAGTDGPPPSPYRLSATPIRLDGPPPLPGAPALPARVLLLVRDPDRPASGHDLAPFARTHRFTAAEQRVLELLLQGLAPKAIAERLNLGVRTVRSQLSSLYAKTETRSQRELVAMALRVGREGT